MQESYYQSKSGRPYLKSNESPTRWRDIDPTLAKSTFYRGSGYQVIGKYTPPGPETESPRIVNRSEIAARAMREELEGEEILSHEPQGTHRERAVLLGEEPPSRLLELPERRLHADNEPDTKVDRQLDRELAVPSAGQVRPYRSDEGGAYGSRQGLEDAPGSQSARMQPAEVDERKEQRKSWRL